MEVEETSKSMVIIDGLNSKFLLIKGILKNTPGLQSTPLTQIIGKLELEEGEQAKANSAKKVEKGIALKITKALTRLELEEEDSDLEEESDAMTTLFTKHIKNIGLKGSSKGPFKRKTQRNSHAMSAKEKVTMLRTAQASLRKSLRKSRSHGKRRL